MVLASNHFDRANISTVQAGKNVDDEAGDEDAQVELSHKSAFLCRSPIRLGGIGNLDMAVVRS